MDILIILLVICAAPPLFFLMWIALALVTIFLDKLK